MYPSTSRGSWEIPWLTKVSITSVREGNSEEVTLR